ncbi:MAG TPA: 30S ribosome-binding factor RbfA [Polyangiaceae bacterium]|nr:30S ribosome-binding factor RbfA [Polyangiaceae bacterium]
MAAIKRSARVAEQLKQALEELLTTDVRDPRLSGVVVTRVELTDDLGMLSVHVRLLTGGDDADTRKAALQALDRASAMLKREMVRRVHLRTVPKVRFFYDSGQDRRDRVEELLREVEAERKGKGD